MWRALPGKTEVPGVLSFLLDWFKYLVIIRFRFNVERLLEMFKKPIDRQSAM